MPSVGERKNPSMGNFSHDPMYQYAARFNDINKRIQHEAHCDLMYEPAKAASFQASQDALREFFVEDSVVCREHMTAEQVQDEMDMMNEVCTNDIQGLREAGLTGINSFNPLVGLSLPMHKYLMMNCMFAQALPRYVAKAPSWTETMETRYMITRDGKKIDIANQQNLIYSAWKQQNPSVEVPIALPESSKLDILDKYFNGTNRLTHNLSVATHISHVAVEEYVEAGAQTLTVAQDGTITEAPAAAAGKALVWKPWKAEFTPGYGPANRILVSPITIEVVKDATGATEVFSDTLFATQQDNLFNITAAKVKAVKMSARFDASARSLPTNRVSWEERTTFVQIPEQDGITIPVTPEEVKDVGANYGINQITKYMSIIKEILENVKDDDLKYDLDDSFERLDDDHRSAKTIDFAPRAGYYGTHIDWMKSTFMDTLDQFVSGLLTVLRDPNMTITVIGRPELIRRITPTEYTYTTPSSIGPVELDFKKTVVTSDKRVYQFLSSDKMWGNDNLIVLLIPKNTNRIVYRLYDYQMYISNEIRDVENPQLPAITAFQRYKFFEYQPVQGRLFCANPSGLREHLPNVDPVGEMYANNDLGSVYTHYDGATGRNVQTPNVLPNSNTADAGAGEGEDKGDGANLGG